MEKQINPFEKLIEMGWKVEVATYLGIGLLLGFFYLMYKYVPWPPLMEKSNIVMVYFLLPMMKFFLFLVFVLAAYVLMRLIWLCILSLMGRLGKEK